MSKFVAVLLGCLGFAVSGCSTPGTSTMPLIPNEEIMLVAGPGGTITTGAALTAVAVYLIYDPLAPNWEITESRLDQSTYQFSLKMKRYNTGGDGDAIAIVKRRAVQLQQQTAGIAGYKIVAFEQGIDSQTIGARRFAEARITLTPEFAPAPKLPPPELVPTSSGATTGVAQAVASPAKANKIKPSATKTGN
jgi:hypothetical protein